MGGSSSSGDGSGDREHDLAAAVSLGEQPLGVGSLVQGEGPRYPDRQLPGFGQLHEGVQVGLVRVGEDLDGPGVFVRAGDGGGSDVGGADALRDREGASVGGVQDGIDSPGASTRTRSVRPSP
jgi:hypothetical protein